MASDSAADNGNDPSSIQVPYINLKSNKCNSEDKHSSPTQLISRSEFDAAYNTFQALHIRGYKASTQSKDIQFNAIDIQPLFESLKEQDKKSFCIENKANESTQSPSQFLSTNDTTQRGYCSFLVQHSKLEMDKLLSNRLPVIHLPVANNESNDDNNTMKVDYGPAIWFFFGKNYINTGENSDGNNATMLQGRPEHTDSVTHDGTWHYQLSGTKIWRLRPTMELIKRIKEYTTEHQQKGEEKSLSGTKRKIDKADGKSNHDDSTDKSYIEVKCEQGDILFLNTRLWWHSTLIPKQDVACISYARDIYFQSMEKSGSCNSNNEQSNNKDDSQVSIQDNIHQQSSMTNVDGTYAAEDVEADTILFTEHAMPDCELHRSKTNANCQVVELDDEKTGERYMAVVTLREIKAGEFFSILETDDEEDSEEEECEDDNDWEDEDLIKCERAT